MTAHRLHDVGSAMKVSRSQGSESLFWCVSVSDHKSSSFSAGASPSSPPACRTSCSSSSRASLQFECGVSLESDEPVLLVATSASRASFHVPCGPSMESTDVTLPAALAPRASLHVSFGRSVNLTDDATLPALRTSLHPSCGVSLDSTLPASTPRASLHVCFGVPLDSTHATPLVTTSKLAAGGCERMGAAVATKARMERRRKSKRSFILCSSLVCVVV
ncbi:hypothetical protein BJ166DRAFT_511403 [Pestalotiopsis sp. NC0098]|nr:hypothetical protein BJ166DRAFT_511403 [Pestalotiopsis sp. NC0098]